MLAFCSVSYYKLGKTILERFHNMTVLSGDLTALVQQTSALALGAKTMRSILVCDVVESVRWMQNHEDHAVARWSAYTQDMRSTVIPEYGGSVVKSTGDGMLIEFSTVVNAVLAATAMQAAATVGNQGLELDKHMHLRIGIHHTEARRDAHDIYGHGVNLAARITSLAGPGEVVVSEDARDCITDTLDGEIEDMGECYLKHVAEPERVFRIGPTGSSPIFGTTTRIRRAVAGNHCRHSICVA